MKGDNFTYARTRVKFLLTSKGDNFANKQTKFIIFPTKESIDLSQKKYIFCQQTKVTILPTNKGYNFAHKWGKKILQKKIILPTNKYWFILNTKEIFISKTDRWQIILQMKVKLSHLPIDKNLQTKVIILPAKKGDGWLSLLTKLIILSMNKVENFTHKERFNYPEKKEIQRKVINYFANEGKIITFVCR